MHSEVLSTSLYFIFALLVLVIVHEYGHFQVARWCGVKVVRFSFGFGKVLARWHDKKGTEYAWSLFPLGGYIKMLDETEEKVPLIDKPFAFNNKSVFARIAIVLAGPLFNFLFAFVALWLILVIGMYSLAPIIQSVRPNSVAAHAGLGSKQEIIALNEKKINSWRDFQYAMLPLIGSQDTVNLTVKSLKDGQQRQILVPLSNWQLNDKTPNPLNSLGIEPFFPTIPPVVGEIVPESPAYRAGFQVDDVILQLNGRPINDWMVLVNYVRKHPNALLNISIKRKDTEQNIKVFTGSQIKRGKEEGFIGLRSKKIDESSQWFRLEQKNPIDAIGIAFKQTLDLTGTTFALIGRLITGHLGLKNISGPVGIAQGAGDSGRGGIVSYLFFLALVSISLGALNLLPIPLLDGGHLVYYALEVITGKPVSEEIKTIGTYFGAFVLIALMCIALTNDISRLIS